MRLMGAGKTVVGRELAKITGRKFVDTDELIEKEQGVAIAAIFAAHGEDYFRDLEHEMCKKVSEMKNAVVSTGGGAMTFERNVESIKKNGKVVFLTHRLTLSASALATAQPARFLRIKRTQGGFMTSAARSN